MIMKICTLEQNLRDQDPAATARDAPQARHRRNARRTAGQRQAHRRGSASAGPPPPRHAEPSPDGLLNVSAVCWNASNGPVPRPRVPPRPPAPGRRANRSGRAPPRLDQAQQQVVDHAGGPLLVLAGPGTGKTTTIVAAVADRIENRGIAPERILVLTFSRKAAAELRERITARLRRTTREPLAVTFHSYAYALARREFVLAGDEPPRLLSAPEQLLEVRRMLKGEVAATAAPAGRSGCGRPWPPGASPRRCVTCCSARPSAAWTAAGCASSASTRTATTGWPPPGSSTGTRPASTWRRSRPTTTPRSSASPPPCSAARRPGSASAAPTTWCWWTSTRTATRLRSRC